MSLWLMVGIVMFPVVGLVLGMGITLLILTLTDLIEEAWRKLR